jgi:hypothetical protein
MATNALDNIILDFCQDNEAIHGDDVKERSHLAKKLSGKLRDGFLQHFNVSNPVSCDMNQSLTLALRHR